MTQQLKSFRLGRAKPIQSHLKEKNMDAITTPNITRLTDRLWTGGDLPEGTPQAAAVLENWLLQGITHIADTRSEWSDEALVADIAPQVTYLSVGIEDGGQPLPDEWFDTVVSYAVRSMSGGGTVLVHCHMGINRGPSAAFAILLATGWDPIDAINHIRLERPIAGVTYAESALHWWHRRTDAPELARQEDLHRLADWRSRNPHDTVRIIRQVEAVRAAQSADPVSAAGQALPGVPTSQLELFDPYLYSTVACEDHRAGLSLTDIRALALDPDPAIRQVAACSPWCVDGGLQLVLASDPDESVVWSLLGTIDPGVEACGMIIDGPHVAVRRHLAGRKLRPELLERLALDTDPVVAEAARQSLHRHQHNSEMRLGAARGQEYEPEHSHSACGPRTDHWSDLPEQAEQASLRSNSPSIFERMIVLGRRLATFTSSPSGAAQRPCETSLGFPFGMETAER
jgi:dual specificity phosphatase 3